MSGIVNSVLAGLIAGIMGVVFATSYASIIFSGDLLTHLPDGIGIALLSGTFMSAVVAFMSSYPATVAMPQDVNSIVFGVAAAGIAASLSSSAPGDAVFATVVVAMMATAFVTGAAFLALGHFRLGGLVRFIPYPVIGGFLGAIGWLLIKAGIELMAGATLNLKTLTALLTPRALALWVPGVAYGGALFLLTRRYRHYLLFPSLMVGSIVAFHLSLWGAGISLSDAEGRGWLLGPFPETGTFNPIAPSFFIEARWAAALVQVPTIATIAVLSVIGLLLNVSALEIALERDMDLNRELRSAGVGNLLAALAGGMSGHHYLSLTMLSHRIGGETRVVGLTAAAVCGFALLVGPSALSYLPKLVLGGVIVFLGIGFLIEWLGESRAKLPFFDYLIVLLIFLVASTVGFLEGVAVGILASAVLFIVNYSQIDLVHHALSGDSYRSNVARSKTQTQVLQSEGKGLLVLKLQGFVFFGTAKRLLDRLQERVGQKDACLRYVVLDFTMVSGLDSSAVMSFVKMRQLAHSQKIVLVLTHLSSALAVQLEAAGFPLDDDDTVKVFAELDRGLEWCEDRLLSAAGIDPVVEHEMVLEVLRHEFSEDVNAAGVLAYLERQEVDEGQYLMHQGELAGELFFIESGRLSVQLELEEGEILRLLSAGLGTVGEVSLYTGTPRTASVVVDEPSVVYRLTTDSLRLMESERPRLAAAFHQFIARHLALRLADTTRVLREVLT